jgi:hypothetical protein
MPSGSGGAGHLIERCVDARRDGAVLGLDAQQRPQRVDLERGRGVCRQHMAKGGGGGEGEGKKREEATHRDC